MLLLKLKRLRLIYLNSDNFRVDWDTKISRDIFWEESMHGIYPENVVVNARYSLMMADFFLTI